MLCVYVCMYVCMYVNAVCVRKFVVASCCCIACVLLLYLEGTGQTDSLCSVICTSAWCVCVPVNVCSPELSVCNPFLYIGSAPALQPPQPGGSQAVQMSLESRVDSE